MKTVLYHPSLYISEIQREHKVTVISKRSKTNIYFTVASIVPPIQTVAIESDHIEMPWNGFLKVP